MDSQFIAPLGGKLEEAYFCFAWWKKGQHLQIQYTVKLYDLYGPEITACRAVYALVCVIPTMHQHSNNLKCMHASGNGSFDRCRPWVGMLPFLILPTGGAISCEYHLLNLYIVLFSTGMCSGNQNRPKFATLKKKKKKKKKKRGKY